MILPGDLNQFVGRQREFARLQPLLQSRLWIAQLVRVGQRFETFGIDAVDDGLRDRKAGVEIDRAEQRFERVGENGLAPVTAGLAFPAAEYQVFADLEFRRNGGERRVLDERRSQPAQVALVRLRSQTEQRFRDNEIEYGVAQEFEALVIAPLGAAVCQRPREQALVFEPVLQRLFEPAFGLVQYDRSLLPWPRRGRCC